MHPRRQGFSLLEMMAAILLLALAMTAWMSLAGHSRQLQVRASQQSHWALEAHSILEAAWTEPMPKLGVRHGVLADGRHWHMLTEVIRTSDQPQSMRLFRFHLALDGSGARHALGSEWTLLQLAKVEPEAPSP